MSQTPLTIAPLDRWRNVKAFAAISAVGVLGFSACGTGEVASVGVESPDSFGACDMSESQLEIGPIEILWTSGSVEAVVVVEDVTSIDWDELERSDPEGILIDSEGRELTGEDAARALAEVPGYVPQVSLPVDGATVQLVASRSQDITSVAVELYVDNSTASSLGPDTDLLVLARPSPVHKDGWTAIEVAVLGSDGSVEFLGNCTRVALTEPFERYVLEENGDPSEAVAVLLDRVTAAANNPVDPTPVPDPPTEAEVWDATPVERRIFSNAPAEVQQRAQIVEVRITSDSAAGLGENVLCVFQQGLGWTDCIAASAFDTEADWTSFGFLVDGDGAIELWVVPDGSQAPWSDRLGEPAAIDRRAVTDDALPETAPLFAIDETRVVQVEG